MLIALSKKKIKVENKYNLTFAGVQVRAQDSIGPRKTMSMLSHKLGENVVVVVSRQGFSL